MIVMKSEMKKENPSEADFGERDTFLFFPFIVYSCLGLLLKGTLSQHATAASNMSHLCILSMFQSITRVISPVIGFKELSSEICGWVY